MVQADQGSGRPFTRTRWWWIRHAPVRAHGGRIYGQADLACDCSDEALLQSVARVLPKGAVWVSSHLVRARHTAEALWRCGYLQENEAAPPPSGGSGLCRTASGRVAGPRPLALCGRAARPGG